MTHALAIVGHGKMGRLVEQLAPEYGFEVCACFRSRNNENGSALTPEAMNRAEVAIEFSTPAAAPRNLHALAESGVRTVCGTTGWLDHLPTIRSAFEESKTGFIWGPNFSIGLNLFRQIISEAAKRFAAQEDYGAWGWEIHHAAKKDSPSGTLLALAADMKQSGYAREISLSANRAGAVPGTHEIGFDSVADTITIRHTARSREGFARGALRAARWLIGRNGVYEFREILGELR